ncbi:ATP-binding protein [Micromonospora rifamycinica]|uniref:Predicted ATPase n=1 Tax=Micromonospora rifamycinica TaxID=291594 RepID=A0A1C5JQA5_9ACTN|nr:helix-turn-helix domain-containing protein [Micromonospora rifamycinica]SCG72409.1 Predicted ATPase [Micromonospora rifamycinica]
MTPDHDHSAGTGGPTPIGELVRSHRLAAGLTQADLAQRAGVGVRTIRDLERGRAHRPQRTTAELLAGALGLTGTARAGFLASARGTAAVDPAEPPTAGLPHRPAPTGAARRDLDLPGTPMALPPAVELIGRERELDELAGLLTGDGWPPVLSLVGLAGVGKTALALAVAHAVADAHPGGVAGVLIGVGSDANDVLAAACAVLGAARLAELAARLRGRPALLLVDAVERAPDPVAEVLHLLVTAVPTLRVVVTGRHPVGIPGELVRPVAPLEVPPAGVVDPDELARWPAAALFTARLTRVRPEPPGPDELPALTALVRRLDGLPLAIELMAARGRILDLPELLGRYGDRVLDLAGPDLGGRGWEAAPPGRTAEPARTAVAVTLREAVATSYRLLDAGEQAALRRLSVFANRWSVELAEELLVDEADRDPAAPVDPVPLLDRLVELGLASVRGAGPLRFRLLDAVREYAIEQAAGRGELTAARRRHAVVITRLVTRTAPDLVGARHSSAVRRLDEATGDIGAALAHAARDDPDTALRLAAALPRWWRMRGRDVSGRQWLRRLLADPRTAHADPVLRAWAALGVARLAAGHGAAAQELPAVRAALAVLAGRADVAGELAARSILGTLLVVTGSYDEAAEQAHSVLTLATRHGRTRDMAVAQHHLAWHEIRLGDLPAARRRLAAVDRLAAHCGESRLRLLARADLAEVARLAGRYSDAVEQGRRVIAALAGVGDPGHRRQVLGTVGLALARSGRLEEAAEVLAELRCDGRAGPSPSRAAVEAGTAGEALPGARPVGDGPVRPEEGVCALIEATMAQHRGDRELAAEWFAVAVTAGAAGQDRRDVIEALVGLAASTGSAEARERLALACRHAGIRLLPAEERLLG